MSSAEEFEKYAILKNMFRRRSSTEFTGACFAQVMNADQMPKILNHCQSHVNPDELRKQIDQVDPAHTGKLTFDQYTKICNQFVRDPTVSPTALEFKTLSDFET
ncbi:Troponin C, isoform 2 [Orchesella cincta]|uniref:Troponin C, isoform 2 n=1 Tax=Orchesella cincta TaxID=48709 RepID=A0A1D2N853_ORCCI|nr:Troponin C, isoform 2 [Orchesella cincta]